MTMPAKQGVDALTDREKQTLRLIVRGHDAKSTARSLGLSVHTINERLRDARRKLAVSSSREAARLLLAAEGDNAPASLPELSGDNEIRDDAERQPADQEGAPIAGAGWLHRHPRTIIGVFVMTPALAILMLFASPLSPVAPPAPVAQDSAFDPEVMATAQHWLTLLDQSKWEESYRATGAAFRKLNTLAVWTSASEKVRAPLGAMVSRTAISQENLPAPPAGYEVVKFRTSFANKADVIETVSLDKEDGVWRVVGVTVG